MQTSISHLGTALLLAAMTGTIGCGSPLDDNRRVVGTIDNGAAFDPLTVADTATAGVALTATITTMAGGCTQADGARVTVGASVVDITPYDILPPSGTACISIIKQLPRPVELTFDTPGSVTVRVHGRGLHGDKTVERLITVVP